MRQTWCDPGLSWAACRIRSASIQSEARSQSSITSTTFALQVLALGGELLSNAESLLRSGLHTTEVADGYLKAGSKVRMHSNPDQPASQAPNRISCPDELFGCRRWKSWKPSCTPVPTSWTCGMQMQ